LQRYGEPATATATATSDTDADRAARWTIRLLAVAVFVVVIAIVLRLTVSSLDTSNRSSSSDRAGAQAGRSTTVDDLGPRPGVEVATYAQNRRGALAGATGDRVAVVSLSSYATEAQARSLVGSFAVVALLVAPSGTAPSTVVGSLTTWANGQTTALRDERDEIRKLLPTVTDPAFKDFYTTEIARLDKAAQAVSPIAPIVFGVVAKGPAAALQTLGARPELRLVDVGEGHRPAPRPRIAAYGPRRGSRPMTPRSGRPERAAMAPGHHSPTGRRGPASGHRQGPWRRRHRHAGGAARIGLPRAARLG